MVGQELHVVLLDGTRMLVRPIRPDDRERIAAGFELLSPRSRYLRFHGHVDHLSDEQLRYLTEVDQRDHAAWVALDEDRPQHPGMGVARYVRERAEPNVAEVAVTVVDEYQGRGVGTVLLGVLGRAARDQGLDTFRTYVLADNEMMTGFLDDLGVRSAPVSDGVRQVDVPIVPDPAELPDTPAGRVLRAVAAGRLRMLLSTVVPIRITEDLTPPPEPAGSTDLDGWLGAATGAGTERGNTP